MAGRLRAGDCPSGIRMGGRLAPLAEGSTINGSYQAAVIAFVLT